MGELITGWLVAGDQALAEQLRLSAEPTYGYTPADLDAASTDYRNARGWVLARITDITEHMEEQQHDHDT